MALEQVAYVVSAACQGLKNCNGYQLTVMHMNKSFICNYELAYRAGFPLEAVFKP
jgi:hypothetical protein